MAPSSPSCVSVNTPPTGDPFWINPDDSPTGEVNSLKARDDTANADTIEQIASQPIANWLTDDNSASAASVAQLVNAASAAGKIPVLLAYDIPWRDCSQYSSGGASNPADYDHFIDGIVSGIGQKRVVMIVEPDALSEMTCLPSSQQASYHQMLNYAAHRLTIDANASVYVDAGTPGWQSASYEAAGLNQVLAGTRAGFALNVSNFYSTAADISYGTQISEMVGGKHFVIDTSRNGGNVTGGQWCNPSGAALGTRPTTDTGNSLADAFLWIKVPGESDGSCNGGPAAGQFWLSYALALVNNQPEG